MKNQIRKFQLADFVVRTDYTDMNNRKIKLFYPDCEMLN